MKVKTPKVKQPKYSLGPYKPILDQINARAEYYKSLSDEELQGMTPKFKKELEEGKTTDDILVEAFAAIREAAGRVLHMYPFDVQVIGGIVLQKGKIAEMRTGEGKTLVATMPLYLNALTGKSTILVTMNDYLAVRDGQQMSELYAWMGLSTGIGCKLNGEQLKNPEKKQVYACDIVYTTHAALGFDYLFENLSNSKSEQYLREYYYVLIDEADSVLLDSAQTPLIISGKPRVQSNLYELADGFVSTLKKNIDYETEETRNCWLTEKGVAKAEKYFLIDNLFDQCNFELLRHITLSLHAHALLEKDKKYIVDGNKVQLLDAQSGRVMPNTKMSGGLHQALEAKEHCEISQESRSMATITYQSFFNIFPKRAGMTGTGKVDEEEFQEIYGLDIVPIPTNHPIQRIDAPDLAFYNEEDMIAAAMQEIFMIHATGQPILVVANNIRRSHLISQQLLRKGIPHNVLNAYNTVKEAEIIADAGQRDAVTVATSVAGRGTDIKLGKGIDEMGGLYVLGIGRMENRRQEQQARGRSGRQGNHGYSVFYVCLEDDVTILFGAEYLQDEARRHGRAPESMLHKINAAQLASEQNGRSARRSTSEFGESIKAQRDLVYKMREEIIKVVKTDPKYYLGIEDEIIKKFVEENRRSLNAAFVTRYVLDNLSNTMRKFPAEEEAGTMRDARAYLRNLAESLLEEKNKQFHTETQKENFYRLMTLKALDNAWIEQVDYLQQLRQAISGRAYAQRNVIYEYHKEAYASFEKMVLSIKQNMMRNIFLGEVHYDDNGRASVRLP